MLLPVRSQTRRGDLGPSGVFREFGFTHHLSLITARSALILFIADLFHPVDRLAVERFLNGDVRHRGRRRGAVPMLLTGRKPDHIAWPNFLDRTVPTLHPTK